MKMQAITRHWLTRSLTVSALSLSVLTSTASAGWCDWWTGKPAVQPVPYGPPIFTPNPNPPIVGWGPVVPTTGVTTSTTTVPGASVPGTTMPGTTLAPSTGVPAASIPPTLSMPPSGYGAGALVPNNSVRTNFAPATAAVPCPTCPQPVVAPQPVVSNYVPPNYRTNWVQVPVTTYRPVIATDPVTGLPINAVQPCTTYQWQARRVPSTLFSGLWPSSAPPAVVAAPMGTPVVTNYVPQGVVGSVPAPVVTNYAPQGVIGAVPGTTPVVTNYAPAPGGCQSGACPNVPTIVAPATPAPYATFPSSAAPLTTPLPGSTVPSTSAPGTFVPSTRVPSTPPSSFPTTPNPSTTISPSRTLGQPVTPADTQPRLNPGDFNPGALVPSTRNYAPTEVEQEQMVPVPKIDVPKIDLPPPPVVDPQGSAPIRSPNLVPLGRSSEKPTSTAKPAANPLRLVPDPDAQPLPLRKNEIPQLINPDDRTTQRSLRTPAVSVPVNWSKQPQTPAVTTAKPVVTHIELPLDRPQVKPKAEVLDDSGWTSAAK